MNNLIKINNILINPFAFAGFEFSDEDMCVWAYDVNFDYQSFFIDSQTEYESIKRYLNSLVFKASSVSAVKAPTPFRVKVK